MTTKTKATEPSADESIDAEREADRKAQEEGKLLDDKRFEAEELQLPKIDGEGVDKIAVGFAGRVMLDRSDPADVELMRKMALGHSVTLMVEGKVAHKGHGFTTNKEGDLDAVVFEARLKIETVYKPAGA